jgi:hypothetical protein
VPQPCRA